MTRRSKREIERAVEGFTGRQGRGGADGPAIVWRDSATGEVTDVDGQPVDETAADPVMVIEYEEARSGGQP